MPGGEFQKPPEAGAIIGELVSAVEPILDLARKGPILHRIDELIERNLPVLIYFENYGILDSAIWLPQFLRTLSATREIHGSAPSTRCSGTSG